MVASAGTPQCGTRAEGGFGRDSLPQLPLRGLRRGDDPRTENAHVHARAGDWASAAEDYFLTRCSTVKHWSVLDTGILRSERERRAEQSAGQCKRRGSFAQGKTNEPDDDCKHWNEVRYGRRQARGGLFSTVAVKLILVIEVLNVCLLAPVSEHREGRSLAS